MPRFSSFLFLTFAFSSHADWVQQEPDVQPHSAANSQLWILAERAPADQPISLTVALRVEENRRKILEKTFWEVSDPKHKKYGQHLTMDDITKILDIPEERVRSVQKYFESAGAMAIDVAANRDMLTVNMSARNAEKALNTSLGVFTHLEHPQIRVLRASTAYFLPAKIAQHVSLVGELLRFPHVRPRLELNQSGLGSWPNACSSSECDGKVTPEVLAERYKFPRKHVSNATGSMAVAEFADQYFMDSNLKSFSQGCHRDVAVDKVIGGNKPIAGPEAELDIECIKSVAPQVPLTVVEVGDPWPHGEMLTWVRTISAMSDPPLVHSISYGEDELGIGDGYMQTCNTAFMKAGVRGISILFASGDYGACSQDHGGCGDPPFFLPQFPASSPYVTAVGGTNFVGSDIGEEESWGRSGGGFSRHFDMPDFQKAAVEAYKASPDADLPPQQSYSGGVNDGRGYPDVAALGGEKAPYCIFTGGRFTGLAGTSAATPVVAGIFALLNELRLSQKKSPLGFLNPLIYQNPTAFNDVAQGRQNVEGVGFKAIKRWDPVSGWGTPNYTALAKVVNDLGQASTLVV